MFAIIPSVFFGLLAYVLSCESTGDFFADAINCSRPSQDWSFACGVVAAIFLLVFLDAVARRR